MIANRLFSLYHHFKQYKNTLKKLLSTK